LLLDFDGIDEHTIEIEEDGFEGWVGGCHGFVPCADPTGIWRTGGRSFSSTATPRGDGVSGSSGV
jgi:hypothetical protein